MKLLESENSDLHERIQQMEAETEEINRCFGDLEQLNFDLQKQLDDQAQDHKQSQD